MTDRVDRTYIAERNKRILELYERGTMTYEQIGQHFGLSRGYIKRHVIQSRTTLTATSDRSYARSQASRMARQTHTKPAINTQQRAKARREQIARRQLWLHVIGPLTQAL